MNSPSAQQAIPPVRAMLGSTTIVTDDGSVIGLVFAHAIFIFVASVMATFYYFPANIYSATPLYFITSGLFLLTTYLVPYGSSLFRFKDNYISSLVLHPRSWWAATAIILTLGIVWASLMYKHKLAMALSQSSRPSGRLNR